MALTPNMGTIDRAARVALAIVVGVLYANGTISGTVATVLGVFAVIFVLTSIVSFCPLYLPFGLSTRK